MQIRIIFSFLFLLPLTFLAQTEEVRVLIEKHVEANPLKTSAVSDTIELPISDDFSLKSNLPNPAIWADNKVFINSTIPNQLLSLGAATFDGTDEYGYPYNLNKNTSDTFADVLTSKHIKFTVQPNNLYLSFLYQTGGNGDTPEIDDSLVVEYWVPQDTVWEQVWSAQGTGTASKFNTAIIPVDSAKYLQDGFRFRIGAYGALNGTFDIWNIDYVELDNNRSPADTIIKEPAFVRNHPYITKNFSHIPWFHYSDNQVKDSLAFTYRRNGPPPQGGWALNLGKYYLLKDGSNVKDRLTVPVVTNLNHDVDVDFKVPLKPVITSAPTDEFELFMRTWFDGTAEGIRNNDTVEIKVPFKNYYAYDDGSAEKGYGILNQTNARLAFEFKPIAPDSLKGLFINFAHVGTDATLNTFRVAIWSNNNGEPGLLQYLSDSLYKPEYAYYHNGFMPFELEEAVFVSGNVFIGIVQTKADAIHFGFDVNTTSTTKKYYGSGFQWYESLIPGTLMIRPYFKYTPRDIGIDDKTNTRTSIVFPNPAQDFITIKTENIEDNNHSWILLNNLGQAVQRGISSSIYVQDLPRGIYFLTLETQESRTTHKIILN